MISIPIRSRMWLGTGLIALLAACGGVGNPTVKLTATPTSLEDGQVVTLKAEVSGGAGKMMVEFYKGSEKVGVDDTAPYETSLPLTANDDVTLAFTAKAIAANNQSGSSAAVNVQVKVDKTPPTVTLTTSSPQLNAVGSVTLMASASDNKGVVKVEFYKGTTKLGEATTPTDGIYSLNVELDADDNGTQKYSAKAYDKKGNVGVSAEVNVEVDIDTTAPTISLSTNKTSVTTAGSATLTADASDNKGVTKVEFFEGDDKIGEDLEAPYTLAISYTAAKNGNHTYKAKAFDAKDNNTTSNTVTISVDIDATIPVVTLSSDKANITEATSATLSADASDDKGITKVEFYEGSTLLSTDSDGSDGYKHTLNFPFSEANNGNHTYTAKAYDGNDNSAESDPVNINVDIDATNPSVDLSANPTSLDAVGSVVLSATASDNKGVSKVEFFKNGNPIGEDTTSGDGFSFTVDYNASYKATDSFSAKASDAAGNSATSTPVNVAVDIDIDAPTVNLSASTAKLEAPGTVTLSAANSDNMGVTKLEFYKVGAPNPLLKTVNAPVADPETHDLSYDQNNNGSHKFMVKAYDAKGNVSDSGEVTVVVEIKPNITKFGAAPSSSLTVSDAGGTVNLEWDGEYVRDYTLEVDGGASASITTPGNTSGTITVPANPTNAAKTYTATLKAQAYGSGIADDVEALTITVNPDTTAPTNVVLNSSESEVTEPTTVDLEVTADDNHAVTKVEFFKNGNPIGEDDTPGDGFTLSANIESADVGTAVFSAKAFDEAGNNTMSSDVSVTVNAAMVLSGYSNATLTATRPYTSATPTLTGGTGTKTYSIEPALPANLSIDSGTGVISGTPSAASGNTTYTVTVTDAYGATATTTMDILVNAAPSVGTNYTSPVIAAVGRLFTSSTPAVADGTGPFTFAVSPALPGGMGIDSSTGVISGTPASTTSAINYTVTATDANGATVNFIINIDVNTAPTLSYAVNRNLTVGAAITQGSGENYTYSTGNGTNPRTYAVVGGSLPPGLSVTPNGGNGGRITGTPATAGSYSATIRVTDGAGYTTDATFSIQVNVAPTLSYPSSIITISSAATTAGTVIATPTASGGTGSLSYTIGTSGSGGNFFSFGIRFALNATTGVITAAFNNPATHTGFTRTVTVTDDNGATATFALTFVINP